MKPSGGKAWPFDAACNAHSRAGRTVAADGAAAHCHHSPCSRNRRASSAWRRGWMFMAVWSVAGNSVRRLLTILPGRGQNGPTAGRYNRYGPHSS